MKASVIKRLLDGAVKEVRREPGIQREKGALAVGTARSKAKRWAHAKCVQRTTGRPEVGAKDGDMGKEGRPYLYGLVGDDKDNGIYFECHKHHKNEGMKE